MKQYARCNICRYCTPNSAHMQILHTEQCTYHQHIYELPIIQGFGAQCGQGMLMRHACCFSSRFCSARSQNGVGIFKNFYNISTHPFGLYEQNKMSTNILVNIFIFFDSPFKRFQQFRGPHVEDFGCKTVRMAIVRSCPQALKP